MKVISVKQPWASLIVEGIKDIENRTWKCPEKYIGKRVLIHSSLAKSEFNFRKLQYKELNRLNLRRRYDNEQIKGKIIGSVEIVACVVNHPSIWAKKTELPEQLSNRCIWNWVLANPIKFPKPIPTKGKLSFWEFDLKCPEFAHFGASYPDARCINGFLWDLDSVDGDFLTIGGDHPCPYCNPNAYLQCYGKI